MIYFFEDFEVGREFQSAERNITESEILAFAREFDPQTFHTGEKAHTSSIYDGLIASGWHSGAIAMRLMVDSFIGESASLGSPGLDYLRWPNPMRPGDKVTLFARVVEARRSQSKPDRGIVKLLLELKNKNGELLMETVAVVFLSCRD